MKLKALSENLAGKHSANPWLETVKSDCVRGALTSITMSSVMRCDGKKQLSAEMRSRKWTVKRKILIIVL